MTEGILGYIGMAISLIALFIVFWDHWKDDRLLTKRVQEFYEGIEMLIFSNYKKMIYTKLFDESRGQTKVYEEEMFKYRKKNVFCRGKVKQRFRELSKYLGLTYYKEPNDYINESDHFIDSNGEFFHFFSNLSKNITFDRMKSFYDQRLAKYLIDKEAINIIERYLKILNIT